MYLSHSRFRSDPATRLAEAALQDEFTTDTPASEITRSSAGNVLSGLTWLGPAGEVFSDGGRGFAVVGRDLEQRTGRAVRGRGNLFRDAAVGVATSAAAAGQVGKHPDGLAAEVASEPPPFGSGPVVRLTWASVNPSAWQVVDPALASQLSVGGVGAFSIWLKAETLTRVSQWVTANGVSVGGSQLSIPSLIVRPVWQRFTAIVERLPDEVYANIPKTSKLLSIACFVSCGLDEIPDPKAGVSLLAAYPQFELGDKPSAYVQPDGLARWRGLNSPVIESRVVGYAGSAPSKALVGPWRYVVGDVLLNVDPSPTKPYRGWICIESGNPGGWRGLGVLSSLAASAAA